MAYLKVLCDEIFPENNFELLVWINRNNSVHIKKSLSNNTEYILCYYYGKKDAVFNFKKSEKKFKYNDEYGGYNLLLIEKNNYGLNKRESMYFPIIDKKTGIAFYPKENKRWAFGKDKIEKLNNENKLYFDYNKNRVYYIVREDYYNSCRPVYSNILLSEDCGTYSEVKSKKEIARILGKNVVFETAKPCKLIKHLLKIFNKPNYIILDFFAGSGTTGHAILEFNKENDYNNQFILINNNDNNICSDILYPRLAKLINGYIDQISGEYIDGILANLKYLKLNLI